MTLPLKIKVIIGSTRPGRFSEKPAQWIFDELKKRDGVEAELLDLRDYPMPFYDEQMTPTMITGDYPNPAVQKWAEKIADGDGFIMVSPEYNHSTSAVLKNAIDSIYKEWNNKAVGFVSYGSVGGGRGVEHLRGIAVELQMAPIRNAVHIPGTIVFPVIMGKVEWKPLEDQSLMGAADKMITQLLWWVRALKTARESA